MPATSRYAVFLLVSLVLTSQLLLWLFLYKSGPPPPAAATELLITCQTPLVLYKDQDVLRAIHALLEDAVWFRRISRAGSVEYSKGQVFVKDTMVLVEQKSVKVTVGSLDGLQRSLERSLDLVIRERPRLEGVEFHVKTGTLMAKFSGAVHHHPHPGAEKGGLFGKQVLSPRSVLVWLEDNEANVLGIATIVGMLEPTKDNRYPFRIELPFQPRGNEVLVVAVNAEYCFDAEFPYGPVARGEIRHFLAVGEGIEPWWLCASLYFQQRAMDILESVTVVPPFVSSGFGSPAKFDLPTGAITKYLANEAHTYLSKSISGDTSGLRIDLVELSHDFHTGLRHARIMAYNGDHEMWLDAEHSDTHGIRFSMRNISHHRIVFITAVFGREDRLKRLIQLLNRLSKSRYSKEGPFSVCMVNYEGNQYDIRALLSALPAAVSFQVIDMQGPFTKAPGLQRCIDSLHGDDIAFILDVDIEIDEYLLRNIRRSVVRGKSFFTPIVNYENVDINGTLYDDSPAGYATMGTGILGAYVSDIRSVGGYDIKTFGQHHGWEDTDFFFRLRHSLMTVIRFRENRMVHVPHFRTGTWANSSTIRTGEYFGCLNISQTLDTSATFPNSLSNWRQIVYFRSATPGAPAIKGEVVRQRDDKLLVQIDGMDPPATSWISSRGLLYLDSIFLSSHVTAVSSLQAEERYWLEHLLGSRDQQLFFQSARPPLDGDTISLIFHRPLRLRWPLALRTGHPHSPGKYLRSGSLTSVGVDGTEETSAFVNGVATAWLPRSPEPLLAKLLITVNASQRERLIIQALALPV